MTHASQFRRSPPCVSAFAARNPALWRSSLRGAFLLGAGAALVFAGTGTAKAEEHQTGHHRATAQTIVEGLDHPWAIALLPDGRYLVTERNSGDLRIGDAQGGLSAPVAGVPEIFRPEGATPRSQAGLFDVKLHPDFAADPLIYLSLSEPTDHGATLSVVRGRLAEGPDGARLDEVERIFTLKEEDQDASALHFGGRMAIDPGDGAIFLTVGERRNISRSQDPHDQAGAILRIAPDGEPHASNPYADGGDGDPYIYSWGHRNNQGIGFHPETGELWANGHGPEGGDMLHRIEPGANYGWPYLTAGTDYSGAPLGVGTEHEGMKSAFHYFEDTVAPSGLVVYDGGAFPQWRGDILNGGLAGQAIGRVRVDGDSVAGEEWMFTGIGRVRDLQIADDGALWIVTDEENGRVIRIAAAD